MSSMTGNTAGGPGGPKKLKLKLGAAGAAAAAAAAPSVSQGTVGGSSAVGGIKKVRIKLGGASGSTTQLAAGSPAAPAVIPAATAAAAASAAAAPAPAATAAGGAGDVQQLPAADTAFAQAPAAAVQQYAAGDQADAQQQYLMAQQQQYDPSQQQYYDASMQHMYDPAWQQQYAQQYDPAMLQHYQQYDQMQYMQQYGQYEQEAQQLQQQQSSKLRLSAKAKMAAEFGGGVQETRYTASGRVQRKASRGLARLIAEEGGVPVDHSLAAPPPDSRYDMADMADSPPLERRSTRMVRSRTLNTSEYVDPDEMDFESQDWVLPEDTEPKPEKPKREPRPKKPRTEKPAGQQYAADDDEYDEEPDLAMEDDDKDEDFDLDDEADDEAREVKVRRSGGSRSSRAAAAAMEAARPRTSRRAAAAGVAVAVAAVAGDGSYGGAAAPVAGSPSPSAAAWPALTDQHWDGGKAASSGKGGTSSRRRAGSSGRGSSRPPADDFDDDDDWDLSDEESDEGVTGWNAGGVDDDDEGACFGNMVLGAGYEKSDYTNLVLKPDHFNRPLWVCSDGRIFLETYSPIYKQAYDFLIAIAEPVCRPESIHEYVLTPQSLYAAVSVGLDQQTILGVLDKLSKVKLSPALKRFIAKSTRSYGKVKLVLKHNRFWVETSDLEVLNKLLSNAVIRAARAWDTPGADKRGLVRRAALKEHAAAQLAKLTMAAATEGAAAGAGEEAAAADDADHNAAPQSRPAAAADAPPAPPAPAPAAAAAAAGRAADPFGDSESESDPEDFTAARPRRPPAAAAAAAAAAADAAAAGAAAAAPPTNTAGAAADSDGDEDDFTAVARSKPQPAAGGADAAADGNAPPTAAPGSAAGAATGGAASDNEEEDSDGPVVGGGRRRKRQLVAAAAAATDGDASDMSELDEADLEAAGNAEEAAPGDDPMQVDSQQQQQPKPQRRGRLAATAALAAATGAAALGGADGAVGIAGYEDVEEEEDPEKEVLAFEIQAAEVEKVKKACLPGASGLDCPLLEEYDFVGDTTNPSLDIHLRRGVDLRPYQEKSLSKMFGNGRARSGIIVLPCGAGKSLVGVAAAARVKKATLCLCTSSVSVDQWAYQFTHWTNLHESDVVKFVAGAGSHDAQAEANKERLKQPCVCITTFNMIAHKGKRSAYGEEMMRLLSSREWGLLLLDEVHVVPARMFRQVIAIIKAHCKLGLTATLVREDELIGDLNFLIGPKMYEANWLDLTRSGHIANVQCVEVWCPMTREFFAEYLNREGAHDSIKQLLYVMNPNKFMVCQYLIDWHERVRGDKVIVFSDNVWALETYARALNKPFIYGKTSHSERTLVLANFKRTSTVNTVFLSKVGDNSLDIPEANVLIQISSHAGSRRQEAQRLGRILRAKKGKPGSNQEEEFSAYFYTLVSRDTQEMYYSAKRQQFLVDQGYAFKVLPNLHLQAQAEDFIKYRTQPQQLALLSQVLHSKELVETLERECGKDKYESGDKNDLVAKQGTWGRGKGRKLARSMAHVSGGSEYVYNEWQRGAAAGGGRVMMGGHQGQLAREHQAAKMQKMRQKLL